MSQQRIFTELQTGARRVGEGCSLYPSLTHRVTNNPRRAGIIPKAITSVIKGIESSLLKNVSRTKGIPSEEILPRIPKIEIWNERRRWTFQVKKTDGDFP